MQTPPLGVVLDPDPLPVLAPRTAVMRAGGAFRLVATERIGAAQPILRLTGRIVERPSRHTVQIGAHAHLDMPPDLALDEQLDRYSWRFLNHSCEPNAALSGLKLVAIRTIRPFAELTFDYATTEFEMAEPFACHCGSPHCIGIVRGYRHLDDERRRAIHARVAPHVLELAAARA